MRRPSLFMSVVQRSVWSSVVKQHGAITSEKLRKCSFFLLISFNQMGNKVSVKNICSYFSTIYFSLTLSLISWSDIF